MISRYTSNAMREVWSDESKIEAWCMVEREATKAFEYWGLIDTDTAMDLDQADGPSPYAVWLQEQETGHDVVAFLQAWKLNTQSGRVHRWLHYGLTSSDVVETAQAMQLRRANHLIAAAGYSLLNNLGDLAIQWWDVDRIGRTHGQFAEPTSLGYQFADISMALSRSLDSFGRAAQALEVCHISGPLGNYAHVPRRVEQTAAEALGLETPFSATQVLMRDRLAHWAQCCAVLVSVCEAFALQVRLQTQSEVGTLALVKYPGEVGSSSMPHKNNPVLAEKISGLARLARSYVTPITEGIALWGERDISHSSVERVILPDLCAVTEHALNTAERLVGRLIAGGGRTRDFNGSAAQISNFIQAGHTRASAEELYKAREGGNSLGGVQCPPADIAHTKARLERILENVANHRLYLSACRTHPISGKVLD